MGSKMVMTAVGPDRPGLVNEISSVIHQSGANLEDSRMAVLAGDFALIVLFSGDKSALAKVASQVESLKERLKFQIQLKPASDKTVNDKIDIYLLEIFGVDQPGIVHKISEVLATLKINVKSFESSLTQAAFHGTAMFGLEAEVELQSSTQLKKLTDLLDPVCQSLQLSLDINPKPDSES